MTFQQDDWFKKDNSFGVAAGFVAETDGMQLSQESSTGSQSFVTSKFSFQPKWLLQRIVFLFLTKHFYKNYLNRPESYFPIKKKKNEKFQLGHPGTPAKMFGSLKGSPKF